MKANLSFSFRNRLLAGIAVWCVWVGIQFPGPLQGGWGRMLLLLAPLVIVPLTLRLLSGLPFLPNPLLIRKIGNWTLPAAVLLAIAYLLEQGVLAGILVLPWVAITLAVAWGGFLNIGMSAGRFKLENLAISAGMMYLSVGGFWALADRLGFRPLDFDPEIVFLTVAHFHYAGFVLPIVAGLVYRETKTWLAGMAVLGILAGVLFVAAGIVSTQLHRGPAVESFAAWWLASSAILLAFFQIKIALRKKTPARAALCWSVAGTALIGGMLLAGLYGIRHVYPIAGLDIPMMRALHGSANVFGFGLLAVLGWWFNNGAPCKPLK